MFVSTMAVGILTLIATPIIHHPDRGPEFSHSKRENPHYDPFA